MLIGPLKNISEDTQEMPQPQSTASPRHQKKRDEEQIIPKNNKKTQQNNNNATYETINTQRRTATEKSPWNNLQKITRWLKPALFMQNLTLNFDAAQITTYVHKTSKWQPQPHLEWVLS